MNNFTKLYLMSPDSYNKLILDKLVNQGLDRDMYNIISMKKISDGEKWYLYRQQLIKFANNSRHNEAIVTIPKKPKIRNINDKMRMFDVASQTVRIPKSIHNKSSQAVAGQNEISAQTSPNMNEYSFTSMPQEDDEYFEMAEEDEEEELWSPTARTKPKASLKKKKLNFDEDRRKSLNESIFSIPSGSAMSSAKNLYQKISPISPVRKKKVLAVPGSKKSRQTTLSFPVVKATPRLTRASSKAQASQHGGRCIKWSCMK